MKVIRYCIRSAVTGEYLAVRRIKGRDVTEWTRDRERARLYKTYEDALQGVEQRGLTNPVTIEEGIWESYEKEEK